MREGKSFDITQHQVLQAYKSVKANQGVGGIDGVDFAEYEKDLRNNLYKLWNRMASGSYYPKPVKGVEIPKRNGKMRLLGIPTIEDRVAQMVVRNRFEPLVEPVFLPDSYGYRPDKSALDAVGVTRERCWKMAWLIEFDIVGLFDNIDHEKMMAAVKKHTDEKWIILYTERFLKAPMVMPDGATRERNSGTPQGGVISPVLANLFMHYAFDKWMEREFPNNPWARYADDGVIHCMTEKQAIYIMDKLKVRMQDCKLEIHPEKSRIVYCRSGNFSKRYENESFDFLGYTFRTRSARSKDAIYFSAFTPAVSKSSSKSFREKIRNVVTSNRTLSLKKLAELMNPIIRGWMNYFMRYHASEAWRTGINYVNQTLIRWIKRTFKKAARSYMKAHRLLKRWAKSVPELFYHWKMGYMP